MQGTEYASEGIKRTWALACKRDGMDSKAPTQLPLLFALDAKLGIDNGSLRVYLKYFANFALSFNCLGKCLAICIKNKRIFLCIN